MPEVARVHGSGVGAVGNRPAERGGSLLAEASLPREEWRHGAVGLARKSLALAVESPDQAIPPPRDATPKLARPNPRLLPNDPSS